MSRTTTPVGEFATTGDEVLGALSRGICEMFPFANRIGSASLGRCDRSVF